VRTPANLMITVRIHSGSTEVST